MQTKLKKRFVRKGSGSTSYQFKVPGDGCGTQSVAGKLKLGYYNVLVVQIEESVQEVWDSSRRIQCIFDPASKLIAFQPTLNVTDVPVAQQESQVLTSVLTGTGLDGPPVDQDTRLKIGDPLTLVYHIPEDYKDMFIKNCFASDGQAHRVRLTDDSGCSLRPKLMEAFKRSGNVAYASLTSFRIAEKTTLHLACEVELCRSACRNMTLVCATQMGPATYPTLPPPPSTPPSIPTIQVPSVTTSRPIYSTTPGYYYYTKPPYPVRPPPTYGPVICRPGYSHPQCPPINYSPASPCQGRYNYACPPRYHNPVVHWKTTGHYPIISPLKKFTGK